MDKTFVPSRQFQTRDDVNRFLVGRGLQTREEVVRQVVNVLRGVERTCPFTLCGMGEPARTEVAFLASAAKER